MKNKALLSAFVKRIVLALLLVGVAAISLTGCLFVRDGRGDNRGPSQERMHAFDHDGGHEDRR